MPTFLIYILVFFSLAWFFFLSLKEPRLYIWLYLLASTQFLGFLDFRLIEIRGVFNVMFYLNIITIFSVIILTFYTKRVTYKGLWFLLVIAGLVSFGVLYPVFLGYSNLVNAVTDGKDHLCYFFLGYLLVNKHKIKIKPIYDVVRFIGVSLSIILIVSTLIDISPPAYDVIDLELGARYGIHVYFPTFISLAILLELSPIIIKRDPFSMHFCTILILLTGVKLQGHRSVFLITLTAILFLIIYRGSLKLQIKMTGAAASIAVLILIVAGGYILEEMFIAPVKEVLEGEGAVASRIAYNYFRYKAIMNRPFLGYGFIDESSELGRTFYYTSSSIYTQTLGIVDAGYIDLLVRFGIIGTILILSCYIAIIITAFRVNKYNSTETLIPAVFLASYFAISLTWSVFTYMHGIIPATIAIYLILRATGNERCGRFPPYMFRERLPKNARKDIK